MGGVRTGNGFGNLRLATVISACMSLPIAGAFYGCQQTDNTHDLPNVIIIMTDDHGYGDLECHGNPYLKTPALNRLARESVRFTNFHVNATCMPTRAALMTGRYPDRSGIWHNQARVNMRKEEVTMADIFSSNGYETAIFGKWHLGDMYPFRPQDRGFRHSLIHRSGAVGYVPDYWGNDYFDDVYLLNGNPQQYEGYCTDVWFENATAFIEEKHRDRQPFFLYLCTNAPHSPYRVPEKYSTPFQQISAGDDIANYYGMITNIDENVGRLTEKLEELGLTENTILIFLTDNGTAGGVKVDKEGFPVGKGFNAGMRGKKGSVYEGGHRVPLFIRWPAGIHEQDTERDQLVVHMDILPTLTELIGLKVPGSVTFDGRSFVPLLNGNEDQRSERVSFVQHQPVAYPEKGKRFVAMMDQWRLVNGEELYDVAVDPGQRNNVAEQHPDLVLKLASAYEEWWKDVSKAFDQACPAILGAEEANPTSVTAHEWYFEQYPGPPNYEAETIRTGDYSNGYWEVGIARRGNYEFVLQRWPDEAKEKTPFDAVKARLRIGDVDTAVSISPRAAQVALTLPLEATALTRMQTWITDSKGQLKGAPFVRITRLY